MIRDTITLDADPELFLEKTLDDILFTDQTLRILLKYLQENLRLIEMEEFLDHLSELEWQFAHVLDDLLNHEGDSSVREIPPIREKLIAFRDNCTERRSIITNMIPGDDSTPGEPMVGSDELKELLKAF